MDFKRVALASMLCVVALHTSSFAQTDTLVQVGVVQADGHGALIVAESILKSAFEATLNDGTTMSSVSMYDTLGFYYLVGRGVPPNELGVTIAVRLFEAEDSTGESGLFVYAMSSTADFCVKKCLCTDCVTRHNPATGRASYCDCKGRDPGPCPGEGAEEDYWCRICWGCAFAMNMFVDEIVSRL